MRLAGPGEMPAEHGARDRWLRESIEPLGGDGFGTADEDLRVVVPTGAVLITHCEHHCQMAHFTVSSKLMLRADHIFHRASRHSGGDTPWRPMVKMGAARVSEPAAGAACPPLPGGGSSTPALLESMWRWHHPHEGDNQRLALQTSEEDAEKLTAVQLELENSMSPSASPTHLPAAALRLHSLLERHQ